MMKLMKVMKLKRLMKFENKFINNKDKNVKNKVKLKSEEFEDSDELDENDELEK